MHIGTWRELRVAEHLSANDDGTVCYPMAQAVRKANDHQRMIRVPLVDPKVKRKKRISGLRKLYSIETRPTSAAGEVPEGTAAVEQQQDTADGVVSSAVVDPPNPEDDSLGGTDLIKWTEDLDPNAIASPQVSP
mmetsp:Transcript_20292/g.44982  ORF Transcript_20292/g.44982 Transcript_20292/m.44982 type:complete len:134 (+) Transcript_20292:23-424(+)